MHAQSLCCTWKYVNMFVKMAGIVTSSVERGGLSKELRVFSFFFFLFFLG